MLQADFTGRDKYDARDGFLQVAQIILLGGHLDGRLGILSLTD